MFCKSVPSVTITVNEPLIAGNITGNQSFVQALQRQHLVRQMMQRVDRHKNYQWQSSTDNSSFIDIPGANASVYSPGTLTQTMYYRRGVSTATNSVKYTQAVKITVAPVVAKPVITASGPLKLSANGSVMLASTPAATYLWSDGSTGQTVTVTTPTVGIYKVTVKDALWMQQCRVRCCNSNTSTAIVIDSSYISGGISNPA
jgi:hypothetical protein